MASGQCFEVGWREVSGGAVAPPLFFYWGDFALVPARGVCYTIAVGLNGG